MPHLLDLPTRFLGLGVTAFLVSSVNFTAFVLPFRTFGDLAAFLVSFVTFSAFPLPFRPLGDFLGDLQDIQIFSWTSIIYHKNL